MFFSGSKRLHAITSSLIHRHLDAARVLLNKMIEEMNKEIQRSGCDKKMIEEKEKTMSKSDKKFVDDYNKKKHFLQRSLAGEKIGRIASLGSKAKSRLRYLLQWFQERGEYFKNQKTDDIVMMLTSLIDYIEESMPTINTELHLSIFDVIGAKGSELRKRTSNGNFFVRVYVPGCVPRNGFTLEL